ncbi:MAG TPA: primosomal protein N', partial [Candidatus Cloacimonadota bacterium]|nr:primosomal protein N' [Candidatus Cloacimonadota bacterium]
MFYYHIALAINLDIELTYSSDEQLARGTRVIVSMGRNIMTGVVWQEIAEQDLDKKIRYKKIIEVVDKEPIVNKDLLELSVWMSSYYRVKPGFIIESMLPLSMNLQVQMKIKLKDELNQESLLKKLQVNKTAYSDEYETIISIIQGLESFLRTNSGSEWMEINDLRKTIKVEHFYFWAEWLEEHKYIEIFRKYDEKVKQKVANFIILKEELAEIKLTEKQQEAYDIIKSFGNDFPLSKVADSITYSIIKALKLKGLIEVVPKKLREEPYPFPAVQKIRNITLTDEQKTAIERIRPDIIKHVFKTYLIFGITGSGKTEIYIELILETIKQGKNALMLVPEISLTPQMVEKFYHVFGENIAVLHSSLNDRQRFNQWKKIKNNQCRIVIGARSAIFAPLADIGLIIVDEEHEGSYKQDNTPAYQGRDVAVMRAKINKCVCILGSATPSLESWQNAQNNKYELITLSERPYTAKLPQVHIIDMKDAGAEKLISDFLCEKITERLERKEQIILFQNRRGYSSYIQCLKCGELFKCSECDISMSYHKYDLELCCHYCGKKEHVPRKCPSCGSYLFSYGSAGTEQIELWLEKTFPEARILRMDSDTTKKKDAYESMFHSMRQGHVDILLGTQMISKGLDFPNVTLVGVVSAEVSLNVPDFRSAERTFQLMTQVAGRSGRGDKEGEVIIQTYNPEHYSLVFAA